jgi:glucose-1-phosphate cytidylyltransferase
MKSLILAGGKGTRFSEETTTKPKPMIEILKKPMLLYIIEHYQSFGINDFVILGGTKIDYIVDYFSSKFKNIDKKNNLYEIEKKIKVQILDTGVETATGGRVKKAIESLNLDRFLLTYGDGISNVNIKKLVDFHKTNKTIGTLTAVRPPARFGSLEISDGKVEHFGEKNQANEGWINGGFFVFEKKISEYISYDSTPLELEPLVNLTKENQLSAFKHTGFWQPVDTIREKEMLEKAILNGKY